VFGQGLFRRIDLSPALGRATGYSCPRTPGDTAESVGVSGVSVGETASVFGRGTMVEGVRKIVWRVDSASGLHEPERESSWPPG
jgi:hypothetical protein